MPAQWFCAVCGHLNVTMLMGPKEKCSQCKSERFVHFQPEKSVLRCGKCRTYVPINANHCPKCQQASRPSRLAGATAYPAAPGPRAAVCFAPNCATLVLARPNVDAERLYSIGPGDVLPLYGEDGEFYSLTLPTTELGYVLKASGFLVDIAYDEVKQPLGYVRSRRSGKATAKVIAPQPDGTGVVIYTLQEQDRLPILEEHEDFYLVQLANRARGWVHKAHVFATLSPASLPIDTPAEEMWSLGTILGAAAMFALALAGAAADENREVERIRRGTRAALRDVGW